MKTRVTRLTGAFLGLLAACASGPSILETEAGGSEPLGVEVEIAVSPMLDERIAETEIRATAGVAMSDVSLVFFEDDGDGRYQEEEQLGYRSASTDVPSGRFGFAPCRLPARTENLHVQVRVQTAQGARTSTWALTEAHVLHRM